MELELQIEEQKRKSALVNNLVIDLQSLMSIMQKVFSNDAKSTSEFSELCEFLHKLCANSSNGLDELKSMIPSNIEKVEAE